MDIYIPRPLCGDNTTIALGLSETEAAALAAAGRAAGFSDIGSTMLAVVNEALDVGFRVLREESDAREALGVQAA